MTRPSWDELAQREVEATRLKEAKGLAAMHVRHGLTINQRCGDCAFLILNPMETAGRYYKCSKYRLSSSAATDWRLKWAACGIFEPQQRIKGQTTLSTKGVHDGP